MKLLYGTQVGVDADPVAVRSAMQNAELNGVQDEFTVSSDSWPRILAVASTKVAKGLPLMVPHMA